MSTEEVDRPATIEGYLDEAGPLRLWGWAWAPERPDEAAAVEVFNRAGELVARARALGYRGDLEAAGKRSGRCGFDIALPASGGPFSVLARAPSSEGAPLVLGADVAGPEPQVVLRAFGLPG